MSSSGSPLQSRIYDGVEDREMKAKGKLEFLMGAYTRLKDANVATTETILALQQDVSELTASIHALTKAVGKMPLNQQPPVSESSPSYPQVRSNNLERSREYSLGYRSEELHLANRDKMLKKIEMPSFDGSRTYEWLVDVEHFFMLGRYCDVAKLDVIPLCLQGAAKKWFAWVLKRDGFSDWEDFKQRLVIRFSYSIDNEPEARLFAIRQTGPIADYVSEFEALSSQVPDLADHSLEKIFYNGLSPEMKEVIRMKDPQGLQNYIAAVLKMESSTFCKVVGDASNTSKVQQRSYEKHQYKTQTATDKPKAVFVDAKPRDSGQQSGQRPRQKYSDAELDNMRREGVCFKCGAKWSRAHAAVCPNKELRILTVINGLDLEVVEDINEEIVWQGVPKSPELKTLSYNSFMGISSPKTTNLPGRVGNLKVIVLLDSGASHNFIFPEVVKRLRLKVFADSSLDVLLGNGVIVKGLGVCRSVSFQLNSTTFTSDFISLELGSVDVILGIQWLETLGKCEVDWKEQELSFVYEGKRVTLWGDHSLHSAPSVFKSPPPFFSASNKGSEVLCASGEISSTAPDLPAELSQLLTEFDSIFALPTQLPPFRGIEHAIELIP